MIKQNVAIYPTICHWSVQQDNFDDQNTSVIHEYTSLKEARKFLHDVLRSFHNIGCTITKIKEVEDTYIIDMGLEVRAKIYIVVATEFVCPN